MEEQFPEIQAIGAAEIDRAAFTARLQARFGQVLGWPGQHGFYRLRGQGDQVFAKQGVQAQVIDFHRVAEGRFVSLGQVEVKCLLGVAPDVHAIHGVVVLVFQFIVQSLTKLITQAIEVQFEFIMCDTQLLADGKLKINCALAVDNQFVGEDQRVLGVEAEQHTDAGFRLEVPEANQRVQ
ncbi:hypothetical protein D3C76_1060580 [compost metagenome]